MFKKILAGVAATVLSLGVVALVAGPASAHHNTITVVSVDCVADGSYTVTWSVSNSESDKTEKVTASSLPAVVPVDHVFGMGATETFTQHVATATTETLTLATVWTNGVTGSASTTLDQSAYPKGCIHTTYTLSKQQSVCTGPGTSSNPSYTIGGVGVVWTINGTVTPAGTYPALPGEHFVASVAPLNDSYTIDNSPTSWDYTFPPNKTDCTLKVVPVAPDFMQQVCSGPGDHSPASFTIHAVTGVIYTVKFDGGAEQPTTGGSHIIPDNVTKVQVIARADTANHYTIDGDSVVYPEFTVVHNDCLTTVTPLTPDPAQATCDAAAPGVVPPTTYTLFAVPHVVYLVSTDGINFTPVTITQNTTYTLTTLPAHIYVKATVDDPTKYQVTAFAWDKVFTDPGTCKGKVTPVIPDVAAQFCDDSVTPPVLVSGAIVIKAATNVSYFIDGVPASVGSHNVAPGDHTITVDFDHTKYELDSGVTVPFTVNVKAGACLPTEPLVTPAVASTQITCFHAGSYTLSNDLKKPNAVLWTVNGSPVGQGTYKALTTGVVHIHAAPNGPAFGFNPGSQTDWTFNFKTPTLCDTETLAMTGQSPTGLIVAADLFLVAGLAMFAIRAARRTRKA